MDGPLDQIDRIPICVGTLGQPTGSKAEKLIFANETRDQQEFAPTRRDEASDVSGVAHRSGQFAPAGVMRPQPKRGSAEA